MPNSFSKWLYQFTLLPVAYQSSGALYILINIWFCLFKKILLLVSVSLMTDEVEHNFMLLANCISIVYEMPGQVFAHLNNIGP